MIANAFQWTPTRDVMVLLSFLAAIGVVYAATSVIVIRYLWRLAIGAKKRPTSAWLKWGRRVILTLAVVGVLCGLYAWLVEPYWLETTHAQVPTAKLPPGAKPIRIVHISDLHCDPKARLEDELPQAVAELRPDIICFTGDAANSPAGLANFRRCMTALAKIAPTYAVWGNWEHFFPGLDYYGGTGVQLLDDTSIQQTIDGQPVTIAGIRHRRDLRPGMQRALASIKGEGPVVLLCHMPSIILDLPRLGVDVCLSGHVHGGQVALPFYGAMVTLTPTGKRFERGLYKHEDTHLYVSRGLGMEGGGGKAPRLRFCARPEVTLIELVPDRPAP